MNQTSIWVTAITGVVTAIVAVISLILSGHQTRINNKQHLLDRRLSSWETCWGLYRLYTDTATQSLLSRHLKEEEPYPTVYELDYQQLTNNTLLSKIQKAGSEPLTEKPQREMLIQLEKLRIVSMEIPLLFKGDCTQAFSDFVYEYQELIFKLYQCIGYQKGIREDYGSLPPGARDDMLKALQNCDIYDEVRQTILKMNGIVSSIQANGYVEEIENQIKI